VEWHETARVTPLGQLPFFIEYLEQGGLFDGWVSSCPPYLGGPNAPSKRDVLGTVLLSVLAGRWRYAHMTTLRCDPVNPPLLGMEKVVSEDAVRRGFDKIEETAGLTWLQEQLDYCARTLLNQPWILDVDATVKPLAICLMVADCGAKVPTERMPALIMPVHGSEFAPEDAVADGRIE
jgi:hypothetical protein